MPRPVRRHVSLVSAPSMMLAGTAILAACRGTGPTGETELKIDSAHARFFDLRVESAVALVPGATAAPESPEAMEHYRQQAQNHFRYGWLGQLKGYSAGSDFNRESVEILGTAPGAGGLTEIRYTLSMTLAWPKEAEDPKALHFVTPGRLDSDGVDAVWQKWGEKCSKEHNASFDPYDWRPSYPDCPLRDLTGASEAGTGLIEFDGVLLSRIPAVITPKATTEGRKPEYDRLWADRRLVATIIYAKDSAGSTSPTDLGTRDYNSAYKKLVKAFGAPASVSAQPGPDGPGPAIDDLTVTWKLSWGRRLEVRMFLIDHLSSIAEIQKRLDAGGEAGGDEAERRFLNAYRQRSADSEFIYYGGHSGVGRHIRALPVITAYTKGLHTLYFLDGCNSYDYLDQALTAGVGKANPGAAPTKYLDIISNAYPASFGVEPGPVIVLKALAARKATYRQILSQIDMAQRAIVEGEEDNGSGFPQ